MRGATRSEQAMSIDYTLVFNAGSSSLKFSVYSRTSADGEWSATARGESSATARGESSATARGHWTAAARGAIDGIGSRPHLSVREDGAGDRVLADKDLQQPVGDGSAALDVLTAWLREHYGPSHVLGVGHRVVHGGAKYPEPCIVTPEVVDDLRELIPLAPLHQPHNLGAIEAVARRLPDVPQVACFDTSFHRGQSELSQLVPLPAKIRDGGVQRYGFHGLSYEYIASTLPAVAPEIADGRVIVAHLGSGASLCALKERRSVECTLGFTALDGLCMGTRPGSIDPGVVLHLFQTLGMSAKDVETLLYKQSGLLGISGISSDVRVLLEDRGDAARLALDYFVYEVGKHVGALAAVLGGVDAIVFTAGIGERSSEMRRRIGKACEWLGVRIDPEANERGAGTISTPDSPVAVLVVPTNEELMIARHMDSLLGLSGSSSGGAAVAARSAP
jgi:acetate kinase